MCPDCEYDWSGASVCSRDCGRPDCRPCSEILWRQLHPTEAAEDDYFTAEDEAQRAYEAGFDDWRDYQAEATSAYRHWQRMLRLNAGTEARPGREAPERSVGEP